MERIGLGITPSCAGSPENNRRKISEREYEMYHSSSKYMGVSLNGGDVHDAKNMNVTNIYGNEALVSAEKNVANNTESTGIESSPPMSLEEMSCGSISPIQVQDVGPVIGGFHKSAFVLQKNMETNGKCFEEILKPSPSESLIRYPTKQFLWDHSSCTHNQSTSHTILGNYQTNLAHSEDECAAMKDVGSSNSNILLGERISYEMTNKGYRELTGQKYSNSTSQNKGGKSYEFSNYFLEQKILNIDGPEKLENLSMAHFLQNDAEIDISNQKIGDVSDKGIFNDRELNTSVGRPIICERSDIACKGEMHTRFSWRMEKEKIANNAYYQGETRSKTDLVNQGLWGNVKKVHLPDSSSYIKSLENKEPKFLSVLLNQTEKSKSGNLGKIDACHFNSPSKLSSGENISMTEKLVGDRIAVVEISQVVTNPIIECSTQSKLPEQSSKEQAMGLKFKIYGSERNEANDCKCRQTNECVIQTCRNKQEIEERELYEELKVNTEVNYNLEEEFMPEEGLELTFSGNLRNVTLEEPLLKILPEMQHFEKENWSATKDNDFCLQDKKNTEISEDHNLDHKKVTDSIVKTEPNISEHLDPKISLDCGHEKTEYVTKSVVETKPNITENFDPKISEYLYCNSEKEESAMKSAKETESNTFQEIEANMENSDEMEISKEDGTFKQEIDRLEDNIIAKRETELLLEEHWYVREIGKFDKNSFGEKINEVETPGNVCSQKETMEESVQSSLSLDVNNDKNYEKPMEVSQMSHLDMMEVNCQGINEIQKEMDENQMMDEKRSNNEEITVTFKTNTLTSTPTEIGINIDTENEDRNCVASSNRTDKLHSFEDEVNEQSLRTVELNLVGDEINRGKPNCLNPCMQAENRVQEDASQSNNLAGGHISLEESLILVPFDAGKYVDVDKNAKDDSDSNSKKDSEIGTGTCIYETEVRNKISEGDHLPNLADVNAEGNSSVNSGIPVEENGPTRGIPTAVVEADFKETTDLKDEIIKPWDNNNGSDSIEADGRHLRELSLNLGRMENDKGVNPTRREYWEDKKGRITEGKDELNNGKAYCKEKEYFISLTHNESVDVEQATPNRENTDNSTLEEHSFSETVDILNSKSKNFMDDREDAIHHGKDSELTIHAINENIKECKDKVWEVTDFEIPKDGNNTPNSEMEDKTFANKANSMIVGGNILDDCFGSENSSFNKTFGCSKNKSNVLAQISSLLLNGFEISKPLNISEVRNEVCSGKVLNFPSMSHQADALCVKRYELNDNDGADGNKILHSGSNKNGFCDVKDPMSNDDFEGTNIEIKNTVQIEREVIDEQLNPLAGKCTLNDSIELDKTIDVETSEEVFECENGCYATQKKKDFMISGIELMQNCSKDGCGFLSSGNGNVTSIEIDLCEGNSMNTIKNIEEDLKHPGEFLSLAFGEMEKSSDLHPNSLILDKSNREERFDLNIVPEIELYGKEEHEKLVPNNTAGNQLTLRSESPLRDTPMLNGFPIFNFSEDNNFDNYEIDQQISISNEKLAYPQYLCVSPSIDFSEENHDELSSKYRTSHQDSNVGASLKPFNCANFDEPIADEMCESNSGLDNHSEENVSESRSNDEYEKADFEHENVANLKCSEPFKHGIFMVNRERTASAASKESPKEVSLELVGTLMIEETNDQQIVPNVTDTHNVSVLELDCAPSEKRELFAEAPGKTECVTNMNISNIVDTESDTFSLDSYLDTVLDKQLSSVNKDKTTFLESTTSISSCHTCSRLTNACCQTDLCGLLNTVHSCKCLEIHFLPRGDLEHLKFRGRKRALQALNLESLEFRNKKLKILKHSIPSDILLNNTSLEVETSSKTECAFNHQHQTADLNHETTPLTKNISNGFGNEATSKNSTHALKLPGNEWEELDEGKDEEVERKEVNDQKVPDPEFHQDYVEGLEGKSQKLSDIKQATLPRSLSPFANLYPGSKILRLGLSKRAKLPRLHHQK